jgi:hypothetical protein
MGKRREVKNGEEWGREEKLRMGKNGEEKGRNSYA